MKKIAIIFMTLSLSLSYVPAAVANPSVESQTDNKEPWVSLECRDEKMVDSCRAANRLTETRVDFLELLKST